MFLLKIRFDSFEKVMSEQAEADVIGVDPISDIPI